jgi:hypothetical protein
VQGTNITRIVGATALFILLLAILSRGITGPRIAVRSRRPAGGTGGVNIANFVVNVIIAPNARTP